MKYTDLTGLTYFLNKLKAKARIVETKYKYVTTTAEAVSFTVPDFDSSTMTLSVSINGLEAIEGTHYSISGNVVSITNQLNAGQTVYFVVRKVAF